MLAGDKPREVRLAVLEHDDFAVEQRASGQWLDRRGQLRIAFGDVDAAAVDEAVAVLVDEGESACPVPLDLEEVPVGVEGLGGPGVHRLEESGEHGGVFASEGLAWQSHPIPQTVCRP